MEIEELTRKKIWMSAMDGEGAEFDKDKLLEAIFKFYNDNF